MSESTDFQTDDHVKRIERQLQVEHDVNMKMAERLAAAERVIVAEYKYRKAKSSNNPMAKMVASAERVDARNSYRDLGGSGV